MASTATHQPSLSHSACDAGLISFVRHFISDPTSHVHDGPSNYEFFSSRRVKFHYSRMFARANQSNAALFNYLPPYPVDMIKVVISTHKGPHPHSHTRETCFICIAAAAFNFSTPNNEYELIKFGDGESYGIAFRTRFYVRYGKGLSMLDWRCLVELLVISLGPRDGIWVHPHNPLIRFGVLGHGDGFRRA